MRVLITGTTGMVGSHLAEYLIGRDKYEVHGTLRWRSNRENIAGFQDKMVLHECELRDPYAVTRLLQKVSPQQIYHFAGQSSVSVSWNSPRDTLVNNITAQLNIFESLRQLEISDVRLHIAGSSEEYGFVRNEDLPVNEKNELRPISPYGVSKVTQDTLAYQYYMSHGLKVIRTRAFNQTGPRHSDNFVTSNFARQIAEIELGEREPHIYVGNLDVLRDFTDIRDIVKAYVLAMEKCEPGEVYNIGSDQAVSIKDILDMLLNMTSPGIKVNNDPDRMRPSDVPALYCDSSKFRKQTGWKPEYPLNRTLKDLLDYWRNRIGKSM